MHIEDLDTPALLVDLDGLEDNLDRYQRYFDEHGIGLRPHIKTHKCVAIAHLQMRRGAIGITCQKLGEAEVMAAGGVDRDILIPYNIIGTQKLARLVALARTSTSSVRVGHPADRSGRFRVHRAGTSRGRCRSGCHRGRSRRTRSRPHGRRLTRSGYRSRRKKSIKPPTSNSGASCPCRRLQTCGR